MILVSACLAGINCKYSGGNNYNEKVFNLVKEGKAILQARSPSCGTGKIYSGNFDGKLVQGNGILAELFIKNGIEVISSDEYK